VPLDPEVSVIQSSLLVAVYLQSAPQFKMADPSEAFAETEAPVDCRAYEHVPAKDTPSVWNFLAVVIGSME